VNAEYKLNTYNKGALAQYQTFRRQNGAQDVTIRNEQATINAFCKWAYERGLHDTESFYFPVISISGNDKEKTRRATFTLEEYNSLTKWLRTYVSKTRLKEDYCDEDNAYTRQLFRHFVLIMANTMMRNGEFYQLKWKNVKTFTHEESGKRVVEIGIEEVTTKVRKSRVFYARGGEHFDRWKQLSRYTDKDDYVLIDSNGKNWSGDNRRAQDFHWHKMMAECEIADVKERKVKIYSLRHFGITQRLLNGVTNLTQFALDCGTSVDEITKTYYHTSKEASLKNALMTKE
jgi:integrase